MAGKDTDLAEIGVKRIYTKGLEHLGKAFTMADVPVQKADGFDHMSAIRVAIAIIENEFCRMEHKLSLSPLQVRDERIVTVQHFDGILLIHDVIAPYTASGDRFPRNNATSNRVVKRDSISTDLRSEHAVTA